MNGQERQRLRDKRRIVIKIGSSSLTHQETGDLNLFKMEQLVRIICDLKGAGREVVLVSSGAIAAGRQALNCKKKPGELAQKQAFAAVGQARLMMVYQKLFAEYNQVAAQVLLTKDTMVHEGSRFNARNTFEELLALKTVPIVNENDTVSTSEIPLVDNFGDNDRLSAVVAALIGADLLILLSDGQGGSGKRCGNRRHGGQTGGGPHCHGRRGGYGHRRRKAGGGAPQDHGRGRGRDAFSGPQKCGF